MGIFPFERREELVAHGGEGRLILHGVVADAVDIEGFLRNRASGIHEPAVSLDDFSAPPNDARNFHDAIHRGVSARRFRVDGDELDVRDRRARVELVREPLSDDPDEVRDARVVAARWKTAAALFPCSHGFFADAAGGVLPTGAADPEPGGRAIALTCFPVRCSISSSTQSLRSSSTLNCSSSKWRPLV